MWSSLNVNCCANCSKNLMFSNDGDRVYKVGVEFVTPLGSKVTEEATVYQAMSSVFNFRFLTGLKDPPIKTSSSHFPDNPHEDPESRSVPLCFSCSQTLKELFQRFQEFSSVRSPGSFLSRKLGEIENNYMQALIHLQNHIGFSSSTSSSQGPAVAEGNEHEEMNNSYLVNGGGINNQINNCSPDNLLDVDIKVPANFDDFHDETSSVELILNDDDNTSLSTNKTYTPNPLGSSSIEVTPYSTMPMPRTHFSERKPEAPSKPKRVNLQKSLQSQATSVHRRLAGKIQYNRHFEYITYGNVSKARCVHCRGVYSRTNGGTCSMKYHLLSRHKDVLRQYQQHSLPLLSSSGRGASSRLN